MSDEQRLQKLMADWFPLFRDMRPMLFELGKQFSNHFNEGAPDPLELLRSLKRIKPQAYVDYVSAIGVACAMATMLLAQEHLTDPPVKVEEG